MKKLLITLGAATAVTLPLVAVVSCGKKTPTKNNKENKVTKADAESTSPFKNGGELMKLGTGAEMHTEISKLLTDSKADKEKLVETLNKDADFSKEQKEDLTKFINSYDSPTTAWHVINFIEAATGIKGASGFLGISMDPKIQKEALDAAGVSYKDGDNLPKKLFDYIVRSGSLTIKGIVDDMFKKFGGEDSRFMVNTVQLAAKYDGDKTLTTGSMWGTAAGAMGGDETVKYILGKEGYNLVKN